MNQPDLLKIFEEKEFIIELEMCKVFLEDNSLIPWIILVPKKPFVKNLLGLTLQERIALMKEMELCEKALDSIFSPFQINIGIIGNKVPQLHIHIVARYENDRYFPEVVWGRAGTTYATKERAEVALQIKEEILKNLQAIKTVGV